MKFTKRAYVKVWQNCPEDECEDTTITLYDYEDANELNSIPPVSYCPRCGALIWPDTNSKRKHNQRSTWRSSTNDRRTILVQPVHFRHPCQ